MARPIMGSCNFRSNRQFSFGPLGFNTLSSIQSKSSLNHCLARVQVLINRNVASGVDEGLGSCSNGKNRSIDCLEQLFPLEQLTIHSPNAILSAQRGVAVVPSLNPV